MGTRPNPPIPDPQAVESAEAGDASKILKEDL